MIYRIDPIEQMAEAIVAACEDNEPESERINRIWQTVTSSEFADDVSPVEQVCSVLSMLYDTGALRSPGLQKVKEAYGKAHRLKAL